MRLGAKIVLAARLFSEVYAALARSSAPSVKAAPYRGPRWPRPRHECGRSQVKYELDGKPNFPGETPRFTTLGSHKMGT